MELRVLRYFAAVVREQSISRAAQQLHITQPTLSRQIQDLENELGARLLDRSPNKRVELTDAGRILYDRAREILQLTDRVQREIGGSGPQVFGDVWVGGGETRGMRYIADAAAVLCRRNAGVCFHVYSGNAEAITERMNTGLLDFGVLVGDTDMRRYNVLQLPSSDVWGLVVRHDDPLACMNGISRDVFCRTPLIVSQQSLETNELADWAGQPLDTLKIAATYNLLYNAALLVRAGVGAALALDGLAGPDFAFRPLIPERRAQLNVVWKRSREFSPAAAEFLACLREQIAPKENAPGQEPEL